MVGWKQCVLGLLGLALVACEGDLPQPDVDPIGRGGEAGDNTSGNTPNADENPEPVAPVAEDERPENAPEGDPPEEPEDPPEEPEEPPEDDAEDEEVPDENEAPAVCPPPDLACGDLGPEMAQGLSRYPIVLVHGMGGFEDLGPVGYYFGVPRLLRTAGYAVFVPELDPVNSTPVRAAQLAEQLDHILACTCVDKVNLVGHSQGAIDIRYLTTAMGYGDQVASLTAIAGPHRGTPIADAALGYIDGPAEGIMNALTALFTGVFYGRPEEYPDLAAALESCSSPAREAYNQAWPDDPNVPIYSYAGLSSLFSRGEGVCADADFPAPRRGDVLAPEFALTFAFINLVAGPNDGLVTVESARWGHFRGCVRADHLDQIGQLLGVVDSFDFRRFFVEHAEFLVDEGH